MAVSKKQCLQYVCTYLEDWFSLPPGWITAQTNLRDDLSFDTRALVELGKWINNAQWHDGYVYPGEVAKCKTVGDVAGLIHSKVKAA